MTTVTLLTQAGCHYCDHAKDVLARVCLDHPMVVEELDLDTTQGRALATQHGVLFAPGILVDGEPFGFGRLSEKKLRRHLSRVAPRQ
ncbi:MAG: glutaredoxin family protein [Nocardioidaceae bacterium]